MSEIQSEQQFRFISACLNQPVDYTPVWFMRQAGRYMAEYRAIRSRFSMLEVIQTPDLAAEITLQPVRAFDLDAAIIFSDILPPLIGMGLDLEFVTGVGPVIRKPIASTYDVDLLGTPPASEIMASTLKAIELVQSELASMHVPLIGFAGAPFTLASYALEGGSSKSFQKAKAFMYSQPAAWKRLMEKLVTVVADYLIHQAKAGADALQVFDSWVGCLNQGDYEMYVKPYNTKLFEVVKKAGVPTVNFSTGTAHMLESVASCGGNVVGIDWRMEIDDARRCIDRDQAIQGNLDPAALLAPWRELKPRVDAILRRMEGEPGHIFNLGHGILPTTPVETVKRLVDYVHERTSKPVSIDA
jgi:uroporphyrinogen decarboxylase